MTHLASPLVSVITPTFNRCEYIAQTLESVARQGYANIEHIVVDDGSTDATPEVLKGFGDRIRVIRQPNSGEPVAVNRGFAEARGDILGVVNDDDPVKPDLVAEMVAVFAQRPEILAAYPDWEVIGADGALIDTVRVHDYDYLDVLRWHYCMPGPGTFFRRRVLDLEKGRDPSFRLVGDFELWVRIGLHGPFFHVPKTLATWRYHAASASVTDKGGAMALEHLAILDKLYARPDLPAAVRGVRRQAQASAYYMAGLKTRDRSPVLARRYFLKTLRLSPFYLHRLPPNFRFTRPLALKTLFGLPEGGR